MNPLLIGMDGENVGLLG